MFATGLTTFTDTQATSCITSRNTWKGGNFLSQTFTGTLLCDDGEKIRRLMELEGATDLSTGSNALGTVYIVLISSCNLFYALLLQNKVFDMYNRDLVAQDEASWRRLQSQESSTQNIEEYLHEESVPPSSSTTDNAGHATSSISLPTPRIRSTIDQEEPNQESASATHAGVHSSRVPVTLSSMAGSRTPRQCTRRRSDEQTETETSEELSQPRKRTCNRQRTVALSARDDDDDETVDVDGSEEHDDDEEINSTQLLSHRGKRALNQRSGNENARSTIGSGGSRRSSRRRPNAKK